MVEHLFCKQAVAGSNPIAGSSFTATEPRRFAHATWARRFEISGFAAEKNFHCPMV
jgi:hypothetical protein